MTTAVIVPGRAPNPPDLSAAPPPRKRRRRTATSGATDDCFACRKRAVPCDRKRPYCTQCIDIGKECSGYKTTLTWGVGVASRGKLRGLSCPVAQKTGESSVAGPSPLARRRKSSVQPKTGDAFATPAPAKSNFQPRPTAPQQSLPSPAPVTVAYPASTSGSIVQPQQHAWPILDFTNNRISNQPHQDNLARKHPFGDPRLQRLQTTFTTQFDGRGAPQSATSIGSFAESEFHSPLEYPRTPGSTSLGERIQPLHPTAYNHAPMIGSPTDTLSLHSASIASYPDILSSSIDTIQTTAAPFHDHIASPNNGGLDGFGVGMLAHDDTLISPFGDAQFGFDVFDNAAPNFQEDATNFEHKGLNLMDTRFSNPFFHISPRLQSLMDFYARDICPVIVAFDGAENPYRQHILQLAMRNEGLQHAIAALATNNMRMRHQPVMRQIGFAEEISESYMDNSISEPGPEESYYKQLSIDQLNMQLVDPRAAQDDSVLATLLILCLFHVCDSGFSKFKTQLAGVQKLLTLRGPIGQSDFTRWVEMFFIWFDVMTSTVNDREMQIEPESLDMLDFSANLGALEQFSGCDGRLFKLIARLGRLNLLAQGRPVRAQVKLEKVRKPDQRRRNVPNRPMTAQDFDNIDGNGWGTPIISDDDNDGCRDLRQFTYSEFALPDDRSDFVNEWHDIRARLRAWEMDPAAASTSLPPPGPQAEMGQRDLVHINESFRYSALLYTERLGNPYLPSSHPNFQQYVTQALHHITALPFDSCVNKFLLWPLFIAGTECVDPTHRNIVRTRCIEIQRESGFYNNISSLEVLENVWHDMGRGFQGGIGATDDAREEAARRRDSEVGKTGNYPQAFRWRKAMGRSDGEYIVI